MVWYISRTLVKLLMGFFSLPCANWTLHRPSGQRRRRLGVGAAPADTQHTRRCSSCAASPAPATRPLQMQPARWSRASYPPSRSRQQRRASATGSVRRTPRRAPCWPAWRCRPFSPPPSRLAAHAAAPAPVRRRAAAWPAAWPARTLPKSGMVRVSCSRRWPRASARLRPALRLLAPLPPLHWLLWRPRHGPRHGQGGRPPMRAVLANAERASCMCVCAVCAVCVCGCLMVLCVRVCLFHCLCICQCECVRYSVAASRGSRAPRSTVAGPPAARADADPPSVGHARIEHAAAISRSSVHRRHGAP